MQKQIDDDSDTGLVRKSENLQKYWPLFPNVKADLCMFDVCLILKKHKDNQSFQGL